MTELNQQRFLQVFITKRKLAILFTQFPPRHSSCQVVTRGKSFILSCSWINHSAKISLITWVILFKVNLWIICLPSLFRRFPKHVGNVSYVNTSPLRAEHVIRQNESAKGEEDVKPCMTSVIVTMFETQFLPNFTFLKTAIFLQSNQVKRSRR